MSQFWGQLFGNAESLRSFEEQEEEHAPDEYFREFVRAEEGAVAFVEVARDMLGPWTLWRVECVSEKPLMLLTAKCTEDEAKAELTAELGRLAGVANEGDLI